MRKIFLLLLLVLIVHLGSTRSTYLKRQQQLFDEGEDLEATIEEEIAQIDIDSETVPAIPKLNSHQKWNLIRESGQDPTTRRRNGKAGRGRRDLILAPWRIRHVAPKVVTIPPKPKKAFALPVDTCPKKFDAITKGYNGRTYVFARERVFQIWFEDGLPQKASFLINEFFPGGPRTVSAALTNSRSGVTILFEGRQAYRFRWNRKHKRFQLAKNTPQELPRNVTVTPQSAFEWSDGNQVVMQGEHFIIYDAYWNLATFTGHTRRYFPNLPHDLLGIVYNGDGNTILMYTKTNKLKVYDTKKFKVVQEYPLKLNEFVGCLSS